MSSQFFSCGNRQTLIQDSCDSSGDHTLHSRSTEWHLVNMKKTWPFSHSHMLFLFLCSFFTSLTVVVPQLNQLTLCKAFYSFWYGDDDLGRSTVAGNQAGGITAQSRFYHASFHIILYRKKVSSSSNIEKKNGFDCRTYRRSWRCRCRAGKSAEAQVAPSGMSSESQQPGGHLQSLWNPLWHLKNTHTE